MSNPPAISVALDSREPVLYFPPVRWTTANLLEPASSAEPSPSDSLPLQNVIA